MVSMIMHYCAAQRGLQRALDPNVGSCITCTWRQRLLPCMEPGALQLNVD
jgi:hypothetical protein